MRGFMTIDLVTFFMLRMFKSNNKSIADSGNGPFSVLKESPLSLLSMEYLVSAADFTTRGHLRSTILIFVTADRLSQKRNQWDANTFLWLQPGFLRIVEISRLKRNSIARDLV
jgi:hypothetical protein